METTTKNTSSTGLNNMHPFTEDRTQKFVAFIEREVQDESFQQIAREQRQQHPSKFALYQYGLRQAGMRSLTVDDSIRDHLLYCQNCYREVTRVITWGNELKSILNMPLDAINDVTIPWQPEWAGRMVTAADIPEETHSFQVSNGDMMVTCSWRSKYKTTPAYIQMTWEANIDREQEFLVLFIDPETHSVLKQIPLGTYLEGGTQFPDKMLGFDPSTQNGRWPY